MAKKTFDVEISIIVKKRIKAENESDAVNIAEEQVYDRLENKDFDITSVHSLAEFYDEKAEDEFSRGFKGDFY
jgi:hypothetical protein